MNLRAVPGLPLRYPVHIDHATIAACNVEPVLLVFYGTNDAEYHDLRVHAVADITGARIEVEKPPVNSSLARS